MSNINLLPWREAVKNKQKRDFWVGLVSAAVISFLAVFLVQNYYVNLQHKQQARNQYLEKETAILDHQIGEIKKIKEQKESLKKRIALIQKLQESRNIPTKIFNSLPTIAPSGIYLDSLSFKDASIDLDGKSEANYRVANLMRNIEQREWLGTPSIRSIVALQSQESDMELSKFQLNFAVKLGVPEQEEGAK